MSSSAAAVKVANIAPAVTEDILSELFNLLGDVTSLTLSKSPHGDGNQECIVEFADPLAAITALHLTGTDLGNKTLFVTNVSTNPTNTITPTTNLPTPLLPAPPLLSPVTPTLTHPPNILRNPNINPTILHFDPQKADEIARTVYIGNISSSVSEQELTEIFAACGPVAYVKMAGDPSQATRFAFLEFATQEGATAALQLNNVVIGDRALKVNHSKNAINKAPKRVDIQDAAMRRVREAQLRITNKYSGPGDEVKRDRSETRSVSPHSRARDHDRRDRDRDRDRNRDQVRRRSRSRDEYRRRSRDRRRSRSRSRDRDRERRRRSRSREREHRRSRSREDRDRERRRERRRGESRERDGKDREREGKDRGREKDRERGGHRERNGESNVVKQEKVVDGGGGGMGEDDKTPEFVIDREGDREKRRRGSLERGSPKKVRREKGGGDGEGGGGEERKEKDG
ncbi:Protein srek1IP1 [Rhizophlyctis rosea]|nr:Protein srek1IP1 [Rhizophlyctis rosea]